MAKTSTYIKLWHHLLVATLPEKGQRCFFVFLITPWWKKPGRRKRGGWRLQLFPLRFGVDWWTHVRSGGNFLAILRGRHSPQLRMAIVTKEDLGWGLGGGGYFLKKWRTVLGGERGI